MAEGVAVAGIMGIQFTVCCAECNRLRQFYEAAVRHWAQVLLAAEVNLVNTPSRQSVAVKEKAFDEMNAAKARLTARTLECRFCNARLRVIRKA
jgi:hypothetical protein